MVCFFKKHYLNVCNHTHILLLYFKINIIYECCLSRGTRAIYKRVGWLPSTWLSRIHLQHLTWSPKVPPEVIPEYSARLTLEQVWAWSKSLHFISCRISHYYIVHQRCVI